MSPSTSTVLPLPPEHAMVRPNAVSNEPVGSLAHGTAATNVADSSGLPLREWADRLTGELAARQRLLTELDQVSAGQVEVIESHDTAALLALLDARQRVVDRFVAGQPELLALTASLEERLLQLPETEATAIRDGMRRLSEGLARITARDDAAHVSLRAARAATREEIERSNAAHGARHAYADRPALVNAFADRRG